MSIVIAPDKFKGTLSAPAVAAALANGVRSVRPGAPLALCPMADGGEGTLDVLLAARRGQRRRVACRGPFGDAIDADVGLIDGAAVAVVELAQAAGWTTLAGRRPDPLVASTFGVGELLGAALEAQVSRIVLALGGSVTVDGGCGLAQALGLELFDAAGRRMASPLPPGRLEEVRYVESAAMTARFADVALSIAADVLNPLLGPSGAARTFGPQKGADAAGVERLERGLAHWAGVLESASGWLLRDEPGSGAAGGAALPLMAFARAELSPGADLVMESVELPRHLARADLVVTGEGRLDAQSLLGKAPAAVSRLARSAGVPCVAVVGQCALAEAQRAELFDRVYLLSAGDEPWEQVVRETPQRLARVGQQIATEWS